MEKSVKIGLVGTGGIARHHLDQLKPLEGVEIAALCDVVEERARAMAEEFGGQVYTDYRRMLGEVEMDALYVCVPPFAHQEAEVLAARRGVHLFVEKPVVMDLEKGLEILEEVEKAGVMSSVGYSMRYTPALQAARRLLEGREIAMIGANRWGGVAGDEHHWWRVYEKSGGQLLEQATHQVDAMRWLAGDIKSAYARYARRVTADLPNMTIPDVQLSSFEFASGAVGYVANSCALTRGGHVGDLRAVLRDLVVEVGRNLRVIPEGAADLPVPAGEVLNIDAAFVQAVRSGDPSSILCDYREGLKSAAACLAANQSALSGHLVACWNG
jgi:predicted dehydrogenase